MLLRIVAITLTNIVALLNLPPDEPLSMDDEALRILDESLSILDEALSILDEALSMDDEPLSMNHKSQHPRRTAEPQR